MNTTMTNSEYEVFARFVTFEQATRFVNANFDSMTKRGCTVIGYRKVEDKTQ
jgi:hypothetical protein